MKDEDLQKILETKIETFDFNEVPTLREYFKMLLTELWSKEDSFSGKRPFGNSGWKYDVYGALIKAGHLEGTLDEDGYAESFDDQQAQTLVLELIKSL